MSQPDKKDEKKPAADAPARSAWGWPVSHARLSAPQPLNHTSGAQHTYLVLKKRADAAMNNNDFVAKAMETHPAGVLVTPPEGERFIVPWACLGPVRLGGEGGK